MAGPLCAAGLEPVKVGLLCARKAVGEAGVLSRQGSPGGVEADLEVVLVAED
jgi:hypothetical protein